MRGLILSIPDSLEGKALHVGICSNINEIISLLVVDPSCTNQNRQYLDNSSI